MSTALTWSDFAKRNESLAALGRKLLYQFTLPAGPALAMLATTRADGGPRVHPVCPALYEGGLYVSVRGHSPKCADLARDGRFALHAFPAEKDDESFYCTGRAREVTDAEFYERAKPAFKFNVKPDESLFELRLTAVLHTVWLHPRTPETAPVYAHWRA